MNEKQRGLLESILKDAQSLKRKGLLTEFGEGEVSICKRLLELSKD